MKSAGITSDTMEQSFYDNPYPMWVCDFDSRDIIKVNRSALSLYGYSEEEMLSLKSIDLNAEEEIPLLEDYLRENPKELEGSVTVTHITKWDNRIQLTKISRAVKADGKLCELTVARSVSHKVKAEDGIEESGKILELFKNQLPGSYYLLDRNGDILQWNRYLEEISGYNHEEIRSMNALDFFSKEDKWDIAVAVQTAIDEGYAEVESRIRSKSGSSIPLFFKASRVEVDGRECVFGIGVDITKLKEAQSFAYNQSQLLQAIIDQSKAIIYIKDKKNRFCCVNKRFLDLVGLNGKDVIGQKDSDLLDSEIIREMRQSDKLLKKGELCTVTEHEVLIEREKKTFLFQHMKLNDIDLYKGSIIGYGIDVTEGKKTEKQLKIMLREKEVLLGEIHHRVKNNLAVISGLMDLQLLENDSEDFRTAIRESQSRINSIAYTHEMLYREKNFSQVNLGDNIKNLVESIVTTFGSNVKLKFNTETVVININHALSCSLIINEIVSNALKHAFSKGKDAMITVALYENNGTVYMNVQDNGIGIDKNNAGMENTESLGLQLIRILTKQLEAELSINSKKGVGTTFRLSFSNTHTKGSGSSFREGYSVSVR